MNKIVYIFILFLFTTLNLEAQVKFGVTGGLNLATLGGDDASDFSYEDFGTFNLEKKYIPGFNLGVSAEYFLSDEFSLEGELGYSMLGAKYEGQGDFTIGGTTLEDVELDAHIRTDYITFPIKAKYFVSQNMPIFLGPQLGFNTKAEAEATATYMNNTNTEENNAKESWSDFDFGVKTGLEYISEEGFGGGIGYYHGLSRLDVETDSDVYNRLFNVNLIYKINP